MTMTDGAHVTLPQASMSFHRRACHSPSQRQLSSAHPNLSRKIAHRPVQERNADLRDLYVHDIAAFRSEHFVFLDESAANRQDGFRRYAWSARGTTATQRTWLQRGRRYQILPAYTQDGVLLAQVFDGTTDSAVFYDFASQLLTACGHWPKLRSVLVMGTQEPVDTGHAGRSCVRKCLPQDLYRLVSIQTAS